MNYEQFAEYMDIQMKVTHLPHLVRDDFKGASHYSITLACGLNQIHTVYSAGSGIIDQYAQFARVPQSTAKSKFKPSIEDILTSLCLDATQEDFSDWCDEFGYDDDSIKARDIWRECTKTYENLKSMCGKHFDTLMEIEECADPEPTEDEINERFVNDVLPHVVEQYGEGDTTAVNEAFNNWTDALCKDGEISELLYSIIEYKG